jgi:manganese transport protein
MAGQVIMQGFLHWHVPISVRRLVTMLPALIVLAISVDPTHTLVLSQVVLSFGIPFALIPLVVFTSKSEIMGPLKNSVFTSTAAWSIASVICVLNAFLLYKTFLS